MAAVDATDWAIDGTVNEARREDGRPGRWATAVVAGATATGRTSALIGVSELPPAGGFAIVLVLMVVTLFACTGFASRRTEAAAAGCVTAIGVLFELVAGNFWLAIFGSALPLARALAEGLVAGFFGVLETFLPTAGLTGADLPTAGLAGADLPTAGLAGADLAIDVLLSALFALSRPLASGLTDWLVFPDAVFNFHLSSQELPALAFRWSIIAAALGLTTRRPKSSNH